MSGGRGKAGRSKLWRARSRLYRSQSLQVNSHFSAFFKIYSRPYRAKKKCKHFSSPEKKNTFGGELRLGRTSRAGEVLVENVTDFAGEICQERGRLGRPSRQRRAPRAPWGLPTPDLRSTFGQRLVNVRSTFGQRWVSSLAISGRFLLILQVSSIKTEDKETCICKMVDFPIRKREFRVCGWSGAFWEPQERKEEKTKCIY